MATIEDDPTPSVPFEPYKIIVGTEGDDLLQALPNADSNVGPGSRVYGLGGNDVINDSYLDDVLSGGAGNDIINAGQGSDRIFGGAGDDTITSVANVVRAYFFDENAIDGGAGFDKATIDYRAYFVDTDPIEGPFPTVVFQFNPDGESTFLTTTIKGVEQLSVFATRYDDVISTGRFDDEIQTGAGNDILDGKAGNDRMVGGEGNDSYIVDSAGDTVVEFAGEGTDRVISSVSYTLSAHVENMQLVGNGSTSATGNELANYLGGNSGNNVLDGKAGADTMAGGGGNDSYLVDNAGDLVIEGPGQGIDRVISSINYALSANVENLQLVGNGSTSATGNALANYLGGNGGNNVLDGGAGSDQLYGGGGSDTFIFRAGEAAGDLVGDYQGAGVPGGDVLWLVGYGVGATLTQVGMSDSYTVQSADASIVETFRVAGVTDLVTDGQSFGDVLFA